MGSIRSVTNTRRIVLLLIAIRTAYVRLKYKVITANQVNYIETLILLSFYRV